MTQPRAPGDLPDELPDELATLWYLIRRAGSLMDRQGEELFRRELGISLAQFLVLSVVDAHPGPLSQQAVADRVGLTKGTVSRQVDQAVAADLMTVRVATHTRREHAVALTEAGTALVRRGDALADVSRAAMLGAVDPAELPAAVRVLRSLLQALESAG
jgi:DNA-binding MarR family transcriptional regulator